MRAKNWTAPPGICRYWVPRVEKPKEETMMDVNCVLIVALGGGDGGRTGGKEETYACQG